MRRLNSIPIAWKIILSVILCESVGIISSLFSDVSNNQWFEALQKPTWFPPYFLFGLVWSVLYLLMGISFGLAWHSIGQQERKPLAIRLFFAQLFLNFWWSIIFFSYHLPHVALMEMLLMLYLIILTTIKFYSVSKTAAYLLIPYIAWVSFAAILNMSILILNT